MPEPNPDQVLEVVKRDCGKHYAMKVMHKEMMRRSLGSSWRKKIALEKDLMASLNHPFLVNLAYAFQNTEFLVLVMDLVPAGDLSEFVLTKKRLTADQTRFVIMEVVCVIGYCHLQNVLYRDLKPENLLIDEVGHVRMIDMGLAARITKKQPKRRSRVGTDCYMAPEVRWAKDRREPYGIFLLIRFSSLLRFFLLNTYFVKLLFKPRGSYGQRCIVSSVVAFNVTAFLRHCSLALPNT